MEISQSYALTLAIALGYEYGLKQWWWGLRGTKITQPVYSYVLYRLVHLVLLSGTGLLLFTDVHIVAWMIFSISLVILGSLELLVRAVNSGIQRLTGVSFYQLNYLVPLSLVLSGRLIGYTPRFDLDYRLVFVFIFLAHPSNYFIRWALNKDETVPTNLTASSIFKVPDDNKFTYAYETVATTDVPRDPNLNDQRAKVGRRIGTLERWLIVLLIASKNVSSLGLVITAKSIVRYPQLSDKEFAEYYLFGTLLSVVLALVSGFVVLGGF